MKNVLFIVSTLLMVACNQGQEKTSATALLISNTNVVDVRDGRVISHQDVVIDSGHIKKISSERLDANSFNQHIDGTGKFLMPGLAEMHAHIPQPPTAQKRVEDVLFLYLSNGITTIRGMLGHPAHLELRERANKGEVLSPRIYTSSPSLNGNTVTTKEEAQQKVSAYKADGYDFLKIHPGIQLEVFNQLVETANEVGISFAGHVPVDVGIRHALQSKFASIDHVDGFLEGLVPESANVVPAENGFFGYNFTPLADSGNIDALVQMAKENEVWIVSTQSLFTRWFAPVSADELLKQPEMKYMPQATLDNWKERKIASTAASTGFTEAQWQQFDNTRRQLIKALQDGGHGMLLGSDAPQLFNVPGFSIHHEMDALLEAGLTPAEIIRSGTLNPAIYFGMEGTFGEVKEGQEADLILVNANPMEDLKALQSISGVMHQGQWLNRQALDEKLAEIAKNP